MGPPIPENLNNFYFPDFLFGWSLGQDRGGQDVLPESPAEEGEPSRVRQQPTEGEKRKICRGGKKRKKEKRLNFLSIIQSVSQSIVNSFIQTLNSFIRTSIQSVIFSSTS